MRQEPILCPQTSPEPNHSVHPFRHVSCVAEFLQDWDPHVQFPETDEEVHEKAGTLHAVHTASHWLSAYFQHHCMTTRRQAEGLASPMLIVSSVRPTQPPQLAEQALQLSAAVTTVEHRRTFAHP